MAITQTLTAPPVTLSRASGDAFDADMLTWLAWHNTQQSEYTTFITQTNTLATTVNISETNAGISETNAGISETNAGISETNAADSASSAVNAPGTNATSITSETIGDGAKSLTIQTGKDIVAGMYIVAADSAAPSTNSMHGIVDTYTTGTGALTFTVPTGDFIGTGTKTAWTVSLSSPRAEISNGKLYFLGQI